MQNLLSLLHSLNIQLYAAKTIVPLAALHARCTSRTSYHYNTAHGEVGKYGKIVIFFSLKCGLYGFTKYLVLFKCRLFGGETVQTKRKTCLKKCFLGQFFGPMTHVPP